MTAHSHLLPTRRDGIRRTKKLLHLGRYDVHTFDDPASLAAEFSTDLLGVERARDGHEISLFIKRDSIDVHLVCATQSITLINNDHQQSTDRTAKQL